MSGEPDAYMDMGTSPGQPEESKEEKSVGNINRKVYLSYFRAGSNGFAIFYLFSISVICQVLYSGSDVWLGYWTNQELETVPLDDNILPAPSFTNRNFTAKK